MAGTLTQEERARFAAYLAEQAEANFREVAKLRPISPSEAFKTVLLAGAQTAVAAKLSRDDS